MSKKKFKSGLESLFGDEHKEDYKVEVSTKTEDKVVAKPAHKKGGRKTGKNFIKDLDSLFGDSFMIPANQESDTEKRTSPKNNKTVVRKRVFGLDSLIQSTSEGNVFEINTPQNKRVSFVFNKKKFAKLKSIAKKENLYLKDIIGDVVINYINEYEANRGKIK